MLISTKTIEGNHRQGPPTRILLAFSVTECDSIQSKVSTHEAKGLKAERVAEVSEISSKTAPLPLPFIDAHFIEGRIEDCKRGSLDFSLFCALTLGPDDPAAWRSALQSMESRNMPPKFVDPKQVKSCWITPNGLSNPEFCSPKSLKGCYNGRGGTAPDGRFFVYSFSI